MANIVLIIVVNARVGKQQVLDVHFSTHTSNRMPAQWSARTSTLDNVSGEHGSAGASSLANKSSKGSYPLANIYLH